MTDAGFYIIKDAFFQGFPDPYLKGNKSEHRPHYFAIKDEKTGLYWMVPMSSRVEKYRAIIQKRERNGKPCDFLHICKLDNDRESVFLIQDVFPISEEYIRRPYTINQNHLRLTSEAQAKAVRAKTKKILGLLRRGITFTPTQPNVLAIEKRLLEQQK